MRPEVVDELVTHLVAARGHAVLEGALGSGLGTAVRLCRQLLGEHDLTVREVALDHLGVGRAQSTEKPADGAAGREVVLVDVSDPALLRHTRTEAIGSGDLARLDQVMADLRGRDIPVLVVCRSHPSTAAVVDTAQDRGARHFVLRPWRETHVRALLQARGLDPAEATEITERSGGLPWLVALCCGPPGRRGSSTDHLAASAQAAVERLLDNCPGQLADAVLALAVGYPVSGGPLLPMADDDPVVQADLLGGVADAGLLGADGALPPLVRDSLRAHASPHRLDRWRRQLVEDVLASGRDLAPWAQDLAEQGLEDSRVHDALVRRATELQPLEPALAATALRTAVDQAPADAGLRIELSRLLLLTGDVDGAAQELEAALNAVDDRVPAGLVEVGLGLAWAQDQPQRAVDLVRWAATLDAASVAMPQVALSRYGVGDRAGGDAALDAAVRTPDLVAVASVQAAEGLRASLGPDPASGLPTLVQAAEAARTVTAPAFATDSPAAYAALVGLHIGDPALVRSVVASSLPSPGLGVLARQRLVLLGLWADLDAVPGGVTETALDSLGEAAPRDQVWAIALRARLARHTDDPVRLRQEWAAARELILRHAVSLWQLPPLTELALVAARMHEFDRVRPLWQQAEKLLDRLGQPPLWATPFHWTGVLVALQLGRPQAAAPHAAALVRAAEHWPLAGVLAAAGRAWVRVRAHEVDPEEVERAAGDLARVGYAWEASRLAAHGAAATDDRRVSARLLECARAHRPRPADDRRRPLTAPGGSGTARGRAPSAPGNAADHLRLTERERQVAQLVIEGRTYRQVGEVLFLSAKTVEHHMARLKRRSGAATREELLQVLSAELAPEGG